MSSAKNDSKSQKKIKTLFTTAVWGSEYVDRFLNYSLCTQLSNGNLGSAHPGSLFLLITDTQSQKRIKSSPIYVALTKLIDVECVDFESIVTHSAHKYSMLSACQNYALARSIDFDAIFFGYGDALWADGSYCAALNRIAEGYDAVFAFGYPVLDGEFKAVVSRARPSISESAVTIAPREFAKNVYRYLHPMARANNWESEWMTHCPSYVTWDIPDQGLLFHSFHLHPVVIRVRHNDPAFFVPFCTTLDEEFVAHLYRTSPRIYVCTNSDELAVCSLAEKTDHSYRMEPRRPVNLGDLATFAEGHAGLLHRELFQHPIRLLINDIEEGKWVGAELSAAKVLRDIQARLSVPDSVLALECPAAYSARARRQLTYMHWLDADRTLLGAEYGVTWKDTTTDIASGNYFSRIHHGTNPSLTLRAKFNLWLCKLTLSIILKLHAIGATRLVRVWILPVMPLWLQTWTYEQLFRLGAGRGRVAYATVKPPRSHERLWLFQWFLRIFWAEEMIEMPLETFAEPCAVCGANDIAFVPTFSDLPRVSSDCRPFPAGGRLGICRKCGTVQKPADMQWNADASLIYGRYDMFRQATGHAEQAVFDEKLRSPVRRSAVILSQLDKARPFSPKGRALDVGCGNGPTLRALAALVPGWDLFGHEISDTNESILRSIGGFRKLYTGEVADIPDRFDLIVLSQSLEHVLDPVETLTTLRDKLMPGGVLLVQVPNASLNVFDLVVADHRSHFDPRTLAQTARRAGFKHVVVAEWVFKELTMTVSDSPLEFSSLPEPAQMTVDGLTLRVDWLDSVVAMARNLAETSEQFGVFGTSIAGTWLFGALADRIKFFVDEDPSRIGQRHEDRPILSPAQVPQGATVFIPLIPQMAEGIAARLAEIGIDARIPARQTGF